MGEKLFDGAEDVDDISNIEINEDYARRYEHNKKREDLHRLQELQKKGVIGDSSSSDSDDSSDDDDSDEDVPSKRDLEFFDVLIKVKNQDPSLKEKDVSLFESDEESDGEDESKKKKKKPKKMYLKDVVAKQLIEEGPEFDEDDEGDVPPEKGYFEKNEESKNALLQAVETDDDDGDNFFTVKKKDGDVVVGAGDGDDGELQKLLNAYFGKNDELDENSKFLRDYFGNKMWIDKDEKKKKGRVNVEELDELLEDEEAVERQEDYETNFRHEEVEDDRVLGHSRTVEGSVRQKETARQRQRKSKEERMKIAEMERKAELKHLKNLKKEEIKEKLNKLKKIAGIADDDDVLFQEDDLDDEFDPEEYDRMMNKVFDDKYYGAEDVDPGFGSDEDEDVDIEKPDFEKEDELLGLSKGWDGTGDGFQALREKVLKEKAEAGDDSGSDDGSGDGDGDGDGDGEEGGAEATEEGGRKRKKKLSLVEKAKEALMEEYYKLDYEDSIGDLKTRFKYAKVKPNRYGLSAAEILATDDKELNQYVSLKRIAPFREKEWKVPYGQRREFKTKMNQPLGEGPSKRHNSKRPRVDAVGDDGKAPADAVDGDARKQSRKVRRKEKQAELKISDRRRMAYGKVSSKKSKGKSKK